MCSRLRDSAPARPDPRPPTTLAELRELADVARAGGSAALKVLRDLFDRDPDRLIRLAGGDAAEAVRDILPDRAFAKGDVLGREARLRRVDQIRDDLAGPSPTPIEQRLAVRASICWLDCYTADELSLRRGDDPDGPGADHLDRHRDRARKRFISALKGLAVVRKLAVPFLQVNLATNQLIALDPA